MSPGARNIALGTRCAFPKNLSCAEHGGLQSGNTSHSEKSSSPTCCHRTEQVNPFSRVLGQLPSLPVGNASKLDSSSSDSDCSLWSFEKGYQSSCIRPEQGWWMREKATCTTPGLLQSDLRLAIHSSSTETLYPHVKWRGLHFSVASEYLRRWPWASQASWLCWTGSP